MTHDDPTSRSREESVEHVPLAMPGRSHLPAGMLSTQAGQSAPLEQQHIAGYRPLQELQEG